MRRALLLLPALLLAATAADGQRAAEDRRGWIVNPSPGNWWLVDRDTRWDSGWLISAQGGYMASGMNRLDKDFSEGEWVPTHPNGSYGYGCARMKVRTDRRNRRITRVYSVEQRPLVECRRDRSLPKPPRQP